MLSSTLKKLTRSLITWKFLTNQRSTADVCRKQVRKLIRTCGRLEDIAGTKQNALNLVKNRNDEIKKTFDCFENEHDKL